MFAVLKGFVAVTGVAVGLSVVLSLPSMAGHSSLLRVVCARAWSQMTCHSLLQL